MLSFRCLAVLVIATSAWTLQKDGFATAQGEGRPLRATVETPWHDLQAALLQNGKSILTTPTVEMWQSGCMEPFREALQNADSFQYVSNHQLSERGGGTCMSYAYCIYENCLVPGQSYMFPLNASSNLVLTDDTVVPTQDPDLPARVLTPRSAADVVMAVQFASQNKVGISVKVAGHSLFGASTHGGTLLLKMSTAFPKYALENKSLTECASLLDRDDDTSAMVMACRTAAARGLRAVLRVGGGEIFDEAYRAVFMDWNGQQTDETHKYHLVGGGAGTVSAAGGWVASGGASGTTGMRSYGVGSDQILHVEMVLPNGQHVRFGPSAWDGIGNTTTGYPRTTQVMGYCNANPVANEDAWDWKGCPKQLNINFDDLWYAVRGGGGGTWGVVLSMYYQLQDFPGELQFIINDPTPFSFFLEITDAHAKLAQGLALNKMYLKFLLTFLYKPEELNVSRQASNNCNSPYGRMEFYTPGFLWCYNGAGDTVIDAWQRYLDKPETIGPLVEAGVDTDLISGFKAMFVKLGTYESFAHQFVVTDPNSPVPLGKIPDEGPSALVQQLAYPTLADMTSPAQQRDTQAVHFPLDVILNKLDEIVEIMAEETCSFPNSIAYLMGGFIPLADDGVTSFPSHRRNAAFFRFVRADSFRERYFQVFHDWHGQAITGENFPGSASHNHGFAFEMGPLKEDWTKPCPVDWPQVDRQEKCVSQFESFWGTKTWKRLVKIKEQVDPQGLFINNSGIGWSYASSLPTKTTSHGDEL